MQSYPLTRRPTGPLLALLLLLLLHVPAAANAAPCELAPHSAKIGAGTIVYNSAGSGPTVLLLHGLFADKEQWNAFACALAAAGYATLAVDLPGYGGSTGFQLDDYRLERAVQLLHSLMVQLGEQSLDVAGNSMGGTVAALYAMTYPQQVRSVAFLGSPLGITKWTDDIDQAFYRGINPFIPVTEDELDLELRLLFVSPPQLPPAKRQAILAKYRAQHDHYVQVWNIVDLYDDVLLRNRPARKPTLIVWGRSDAVFGVAGAQVLRSRIPGSELHELPGAGHLLHLENAVEAAKLYTGFLRTVDKQAPREPGADAGPPPAPEPQIIPASFACAAGKKIEAVFDNRPPSNVMLSLSDGRRITLPQAASGSGARYANHDETVVFWNKGRQAFMDENGKTTYDGCEQTAPPLPP